MVFTMKDQMVSLVNAWLTQREHTGREEFFAARLHELTHDQHQCLLDVLDHSTRIESSLSDWEIQECFLLRTKVEKYRYVPKTGVYNLDSDYKGK